MKNKMNKKKWIQLFAETGLTEDMMTKWHRLFESQYPESHQSFLEWLGIAEDEIRKIRQQCS